MSTALPQSTRLNVAKDYYFSTLTISEIQEKHGVANPSNIASDIPKELVNEEMKMLIKLNLKDYFKAINILRENNISVEEISEDFELTEFYNSKLNGA